MSNTRQAARKLTAGQKNKWDEAIADAKKKIAGLRKSIAVFESRRATGQKWPGQLDSQTSEEQHSV